MSKGEGGHRVPPVCLVLSFLGVLPVSGCAGRPSPRPSTSGSGGAPGLEVCWAALQLREWGQSTENPR